MGHIGLTRRRSDAAEAQRSVVAPLRRRVSNFSSGPIQQPMQIRTILLPTDFSECGNYALSYAASLARTFKASIICINVIEPIVPTVGYSGMTEPLPIADITEQLEDSAERELPKLAECDECSGIDVEELVVHGEAASEIVRVAKERDVDLIVIASHGRTGLGRILFGSTAESVVRHASCPVLVVKPPADDNSEE
jgi:nucleotide-binding universal stress UspA family protein